MMTGHILYARVQFQTSSLSSTSSRLVLAYEQYCDSGFFFFRFFFSFLTHIYNHSVYLATRHYILLWSTIGWFKQNCFHRFYYVYSCRIEASVREMTLTIVFENCQRKNWLTTILVASCRNSCQQLT